MPHPKAKVKRKPEARTVHMILMMVSIEDQHIVDTDSNTREIGRSLKEWVEKYIPVKHAVSAKVLEAIKIQKEGN